MDEPVPQIDYKRGQPVVPEGHPLHIEQEVPVPTSPGSPLPTAQAPFAPPPDTVQLLSGLQDLETDLHEYCSGINIQLWPDSAAAKSACDTPFVTPAQRFTESSSFTADTTVPRVLFPSELSASQVVLDFNDTTDTDYCDSEDMAGLHWPWSVLPIGGMDLKVLAIGAARAR